MKKKNAAPAAGNGKDLDVKIFTGLERLSQALRVLLWEVTKSKNLSPIQTQFLLFLANAREGRRRVGAIAEEFNLTPATVSGAVKTLVRKKLITLKFAPHDKRNKIIALTRSGKALAKQVSAWRSVLLDNLAGFPSGTKENVMLFIMRLIESMQKQGVIRVKGMCVLCDNFHANGKLDPRKSYYCSLSNSYFGVRGLKMNCPNSIVKRPKPNIVSL